MVRKLGIVMGSLFLLGGVLAFVPGVTKGGMYFGLFMVNTAHNIMHIASGAVFLIASSLGARPARLWFQLFGAFYAALAVMGFAVGNGLIFGLIMSSPFDSWGHAGLALIMLLIGFAAPKIIGSPSVRPAAQETRPLPRRTVPGNTDPSARTR
jgi:MFS family permease